MIQNNGSSLAPKCPTEHADRVLWMQSRATDQRGDRFSGSVMCGENVCGLFSSSQCLLTKRKYEVTLKTFLQNIWGYYTIKFLCLY